MKKRTRTKLELWLIILATAIASVGLVFGGIAGGDTVPIVWGVFFGIVSLLFVFVDSIE